MFARIVRMNLKPGEGPGYTRTIDEIIPTLRKFTGFTGEIAMVSSDGKEAIGISLWDRKENAEAYHTKGYPEVVKALERHIEGEPELLTYEVTNSTFEVLPVRKAA
ncbi:MAG: hypothetical protein M1404_02215 [Acidobacteria bacterium]|nr:hypothetical protein [Acidobacteriota bacterium]